MERDEQKQEGLKSPLIPKEIESQKRLNKDEIFSELKKQLLLAGPIVSVNLLVCCLQTISVMFVGHLGELALSGASMATSFASTTGFSLLTWTGFSTEAFQDIPKFLRLAVPSAAMICLEIWSFEGLVLLSGLLPNPKLETSVLSISLNTCSMVYMIPLGLSGATSIRVSNELGAGRPKAARLAVCIAICMVVTEGILIATVMILGRRVWGYCYSKEEQVVSYVGELLILVAVSHILDGIQSVLSGTARGGGWQKIGAFANLGAYYLLGIPTGIILAFVYHLGGKGLWAGIIVALFAQVLLLSVVTLCTNWEKEAKKASDRVYDSMIPVEASSSY